MVVVVRDIGVNVSINWLLYKRVHISVKEEGAITTSNWTAENGF